MWVCFIERALVKEKYDIFWSDHQKPLLVFFFFNIALNIWVDVVLGLGIQLNWFVIALSVVLMCASCWFLIWVCNLGLWWQGVLALDHCYYWQSSYGWFGGRRSNRGWLRWLLICWVCCWVSNGVIWVCCSLQVVTMMMMWCRDLGVVDDGLGFFFFLIRKNYYFC